MAAQKRVLDEFEDLTLANTPSKSAKVEGVLTQLSPMKKGKFFDRRLWQDLVGFDSKKQEELAQHKENEKPLIIENCQIIKSWRNGTNS